MGIWLKASLRGDLAEGQLTCAVPKPGRMVSESYRVAFFSGPPPNLTKSQAHYKFLDLGKLGGGQFNLYWVWDLVRLGGGQKKRPPCRIDGGVVWSFISTGTGT